MLWGGEAQPQEVERRSTLPDTGRADDESRVYTRPLDCDAAPAERREGLGRYAVHDVVHTVGLVQCDQWRDPSSEMHAGTVIHQHLNDTCDVRLLYDLEVVVLRARVQPLKSRSTVTRALACARTVTTHTARPVATLRRDARIATRSINGDGQRRSRWRVGAPER